MRDRVRDLLSRYEPGRVAPEPGVPPAGVLLILHERPAGPHIIFQKRTDQVQATRARLVFLAA